MAPAAKHLLLINPWIYDFAAYDLWIKPLGLLYLASILRKNGCKVSYLECLSDSVLMSPEAKAHQSHDSVPDPDSLPNLHFQKKVKPIKRKGDGSGSFYKENINKPLPFKSVPRRFSRYGLPPDIVIKALKQISEPSLILVSSGMTYWYPGCFEIIKILKNIFPRVPILLGGIYARLCPEHAGAFSGADAVFQGDTEGEAMQFIAEMMGWEFSYLPSPSTLDSLPYPAFDLYNPVNYVCLLTSRGCPFNCLYCASRILHPGFSRREPLSVVEEIEFWIKEHNVFNFAFYDDALFIETERHIIPILEGVVSRGLKCAFHSPNGLHLRHLTEPLARLMRRAGFQTLRFSLETSDINRQKDIGFKANNDDLIQAIDLLKGAGFRSQEIGVYLLAGLPGQTSQEVAESIRFVRGCGSKPILSEYSPIPGTTLWPEAIKFSDFDLASEPLYHNNSIFPCQWREFTWDQLNQLKIQARKPLT